MSRIIRIYTISVLFVVCLVHCKNNEGQAEQEFLLEVARQPAEFEKQEAIWMIWSPEEHLLDMSNENVPLEIIQSLAPHSKMVITASTEKLLKRATDLIPEELVSLGKVQLKLIPSEELWTRDMGPNFVELSNGEKAIVDFGFNAWGYTPSDQMDDYTIKMEKYDELLAVDLDLPLSTTDMISEGGDREVNGKGVLMVVKSVEQERNPNMTLEEMENEFKRVLGVTKVIWLEEGLHEDDHTFRGPLTLEDGSLAYTAVTTNGHIDEFARFVNDSTILLASVHPDDMRDPIAQENHNRLEISHGILTKATDQDGDAFHIVRIPLPKIMVEIAKPGDPVYDFISTLEYRDGSTFPDGQPVQIIAAALKTLMRRRHDHKHDISRLNIGHLIACATKRNLMTIVF